MRDRERYRDIDIRDKERGGEREERKARANHAWLIVAEMQVDGTGRDHVTN